MDTDLVHAFYSGDPRTKRQKRTHTVRERSNPSVLRRGRALLLRTENMTESKAGTRLNFILLAQLKRAISSRFPRRLRRHTGHVHQADGERADHTKTRLQIYLNSQK